MKARTVIVEVYKSTVNEENQMVGKWFEENRWGPFFPTDAWNFFQDQLRQALKQYATLPVLSSLDVVSGEHPDTSCIPESAIASWTTEHTPSSAELMNGLRSKIVMHRARMFVA